MNNGSLTLSIESAVAGGSLALLRGSDTLSHRSEGNDSSRAEKVLATIDNMLTEAGIVLRDLDMIAVSIGPGSYSGIRIGVSTALGLSQAVGIECVGVPVLDAIAFAHTGDENFIVAIPVGKNDVAWQRFSGGRALTNPELIPLPAFIELLSQHGNTELLAHVQLVERLDGNIPGSINLRSVGAGVAELVGHFAQLQGKSKSPLQPIYLRNSLAPRSAAF